MRVGYKDCSPGRPERSSAGFSDARPVNRLQGFVLTLYQQQLEASKPAPQVVNNP
jgi:hypothetical protein